MLSIALSPAASVATVPVVAGGWLPGDHSTLVIDLVNDGTGPLSSITLTSVATRSSALDTDRPHGLQQTVQPCSEPWDAVGAGYSCAGTTRASTPVPSSPTRRWTVPRA